MTNMNALIRAKAGLGPRPDAAPPTRSPGNQWLLAVFGRQPKEGDTYATKP